MQVTTTTRTTRPRTGYHRPDGYAPVICSDGNGRQKHAGEHIHTNNLDHTMLGITRRVESRVVILHGVTPGLLRTAQSRLSTVTAIFFWNFRKKDGILLWKK